MKGFEAGSSGVRSSCSDNCATTTVQIKQYFVLQNETLLVVPISIIEIAL